SRPLAIVREKEEWDMFFNQPRHKKVRSGNQSVAAIDDSIHIEQQSVALCSCRFHFERFHASNAPCRMRVQIQQGRFMSGACRDAEFVKSRWEKIFSGASQGRRAIAVPILN